MFQNEFEIWQIYCTLSVFPQMKAGEASYTSFSPLLPFITKWRKVRSSKAHRKKYDLDTRFYTSVYPLFQQRLLYTISLSISPIHMMEEAKRREESGCQERSVSEEVSRRSDFHRLVCNCGGGPLLVGSWSDTPIINQNHRRGSPSPFPAATTTGCSQRLQTLFCVPGVVPNQAVCILREERSVVGDSPGRRSGKALWRDLEMEPL